MRVCPSCGARYEAPAQYCQRDGVPLRIEQEARDPYLGQKILGQFRLEKIVGSGGMGVVYRGWDEGLGRRVAVKILHKDLVTNRDVVARFHREAQIAHQLDHPNIVRLIVFGQLQDGNLYLVLEYLEGPTLLAALDRDGPMPPARVVKIGSAISDAIGYAHRRDIVHRDLKPENIILVNREGDPDHAKVLDFGIAKMLIGSDTLVTQAGLIFGTARYISPEGAQGDPVDKRSDVYSLAVITYQMLSGVTPFDSAEPVQLLLKHIHETPPPLRSHAAARHVPVALEAVVMRALAKAPAARYGDGAAYARALREALAESDPQSQIRSMIPTASMQSFVPPTGVAAIHGVGHAGAAGAQSPAYQASGAPSPEPGSGVRPNPAYAPPSSGQNTMMVGSPIAAVREMRAEQGVAATVPSMHAVNPSSGPYAALSNNGHAAAPAYSPPVYAQPAAAPVYVPPVAAPMYAQPAASPGNPGPIVMPAIRPYTPTIEVDASTYAPPREPTSERFNAWAPSAASATPSSPGIASMDSEEFSVPGLSKRRSGGATSGSGRTVLTVVASVLLTVALGSAAVWVLGLYPSQRREAEVRDLMFRAEDAYRSQHLVHQSDENDVEDLTDAVLALAPAHPRARELRSSAAVSLRNRAVELRNGGHADQAVPLLRSATRLSDDTEIRDLLGTIEREAANPAPPPPAQQTPPPTTPTPHATPHSNTQRPRSPDHDVPAVLPGPDPGPTAPIPAAPSRGPTFTPGRDPSQPSASGNHDPAPTVRQPPSTFAPVHPVIGAPDNPPSQMTGGPSQVDSPPAQPPAQTGDPNGGVAF